jgi:hypothetical protein
MPTPPSKTLAAPSKQLLLPGVNLVRLNQVQTSFCGLWQRHMWRDHCRNGSRIAGGLNDDNVAAPAVDSLSMRSTQRFAAGDGAVFQAASQGRQAKAIRPAMPCPLPGSTAGFQFNAGNAIKIFDIAGQLGCRSRGA